MRREEVRRSLAMHSRGPALAQVPILPDRPTTLFQAVARDSLRRFSRLQCSV